MGFQIGLGQHGGGEENCCLCSAESSCCWDTAPLGSPAAAAQHQAEQGCSCCPSMSSWLWSLTRRRKRGLTWIRGSRGPWGVSRTRVRAETQLRFLWCSFGALSGWAVGWKPGDLVFIPESPLRNHQNLVKSLYCYDSPDSALSQDLGALV